MKKLFLPLVLVLFLASCTNSPKTTDADNPITPSESQVEDYNFVHTVFFWINEGVTDEEKAEFEKGIIKLGEVETIGKYYMGVPADTDREVIDATYDYAWIVHFSDGLAQESYQKDTLHLQFIENYSHLWKKVQVYDTNVKQSN